MKLHTFLLQMEHIPEDGPQKIPAKNVLPCLPQTQGEHCMCHLLVCLGVVQPQAAEDGADHSRNNQSQTDSPSVQLLVLRRANERR